jgi:hypothetical protein
MGDKDRSGGYNIQFDDTNTIHFGRRIRDNFTLTEKIAEGNGILGFSKIIDQNLWNHTSYLEIRKEVYTKRGGGTATDGALVFASKGDGEGRWIATKQKVKNPTVEMEIIAGPYNAQRTALGFGLGLQGNDISETLKVQASKDGENWTTIRTFTHDVDALFALSVFFERTPFEKFFRERKRTRVKIHRKEFPFGNESFYIRIIQDTILDSTISS